MMTVAIRDELGNELNSLAQRTGRSTEEYVEQAVRNLLEDQEDLAIALERLKNPGKRIPLDEVVKDLGLED